MRTPSFYARTVVLVCHATLIVALPVLLKGFGLVLVLPLLAMAPRLWKGRPRAYAAASLLLVFYAGGGLMEAFAGSSHTTAGAGGLFVASVAVLEFCGLVLYTKIRSAEFRNASATAARSSA